MFGLPTDRTKRSSLDLGSHSARHNSLQHKLRKHSVLGAPALFCSLFLLVGLLVVFVPSSVFAESSSPAPASGQAGLQANVGVRDNTSENNELAQVTNKLRESARAYDAALAKSKSIAGQITKKKTQIDALQKVLPGQKKKAILAVRELYKMQQGRSGLLGLILNTRDFNEVLSFLKYLHIIENKNLKDLATLKKTTTDLEAAREALAGDKAAADSETQIAKQALDDNKALREQIQARIKRELEEQARAAQEAIERAKKAAEEAAAKARAEKKKQQEQAKAQAQAKAHAQTQTQTQTQTFKPNPEQKPVPVEIPTTATITPVSISSSKASFIAKWAPRIDSYLSGSPLAGQGKVFAEAAYDYGVDPRLSPAISNTESTKGRYCFLPHNAWGWGHSSWPDWPTAIRAHVAGLARGYGGTLTLAGAQKYCPPCWQNWYVTTLAEMQKI